MEENNVVQVDEELSVISEEIETTEIVEITAEDFQYLVQVQEHILGTNLTFLIFFFLYCFCSLIHLLFRNF